tara:strand:+ start:22 stop:546 length:525 start_codon:yes stop_codon:yes gene_type:complete
MKNHPVNNEYVQNLVEGLQTETRRRPEGTPMGDLQAADSENRKEATQDSLNAQEAEDGGSGVASDIEHGRWQPDIKDAGGSRQRRKVRGAKTPRPFKNTAGRILKKVDENAQAGYPEQGIEGGTPKAAATHKRIMKKLRSAGGGEEYDRKEAEAKADVERKRLEAAPALASMQK